MNNSDCMKTDGFPRGWSLANTCLRGGDVEMQWPEGCRLTWPSASTPVPCPHTPTHPPQCVPFGARDHCFPSPGHTWPPGCLHFLPSVCGVSMRGPRPSPQRPQPLSHPYMTTGKTIALTRRTFVSHSALGQNKLSCHLFSISFPMFHVRVKAFQSQYCSSQQRTKLTVCLNETWSVLTADQDPLRRPITRLSH